MPKHLSSLTALSLALSLAACSGGGGGGGGGSDDDTPVSGEPAATVTVERVSLTGVAVKGLARGAKVEFFPFDETSGDFAATASATGSTDYAGRYQLDFDDDNMPSGVVKIVLSYQTGAELQCDNTNSGDDSTACYATDGAVALGDYYPMPEDFRLESIADFDSSVIDENGARVINITALSTLASALFDADDSTLLTYAEKVAKAVAQIRAILGLPADTDLTGDEPDNLADEADEGDTIYGALNAAFIRIAADQDTSVEAIIQGFITAITNADHIGQIVYKTADSGTWSTLQVLIDAAEGLGNTAAGAFGDVQTEISGAADDDYTSKTPPVVTLGSNRTVTPGASVPLTSTTVQGITETTTYTWQTNAPDVTFSNNGTTTAGNQTITAPQTEGNYRITVTVSDGTLSSSSALTLTVKAATVEGSALDGDYHVIYTARRLEKSQSGLLLSGEMEDGGIMKIATGSEGSVVYEASPFNATNYFFETDLTVTDIVDIATAEEAFTGDGFSQPLAVQSTGLATISIPKQTETNSSEGYYYVDSPFTLRLIPVAKDQSVYLGFGVEDSQEFPLINGVPDTTTVNFDSRSTMNVILGRKNSLSGSSFITSAAYNGFELMFGTDGYDYIGTSVMDMTLNFDGSGAMSSTETLYTSLSGQPRYTFMLYSYSDGVAGDDTYSFTNGRFEFDDIVVEDQAVISEGSHGSILLSNDKSALVVQSVGWNNDIETNASNTAFNTTSGATSRNITTGVYVKSPEQAINLDGKTFAIGAQGFYSSTDSIDNGEASTFGMRSEYGTVTFASNAMTVTLTGRVAEAAMVSTGLELYKPATKTSRTFSLETSTLTTGTDGCLDIVANTYSEGTRVCTDGTTLIVRHYQTEETANAVSESTITNLYLGMFVGTNVTQ